MMNTTSETNNAMQRSVLVRHACGHRYAHLAASFNGAGDLLEAVEFLENHPCPSCILAQEGLVPILQEQQASASAI